MKISIVIPAYNEEPAIGKLIGEIHETLRDEYQYEIIVVDNNSTDRTAQIAKDVGTRVVREYRQGYGSALITGFRSVSSDTAIVVMMDADFSYCPKDIPELIKPIIEDRADFVLGVRAPELREEGSMSLLNKVGNKILDKAIALTGLVVSDGQSGFRAVKKDVIDITPHFVHSTGMEFIDEMLLCANELGYRISEVPVRYRQRIGISKLNPFYDGVRMLLTVFGIIRDYSPFKVFGTLALVLELVAIVLGRYVMYVFFERSYWHSGLTEIVVLLGISGLQLFTIGLLSCTLRNFSRSTNIVLVHLLSKTKDENS